MRSVAERVISNVDKLLRKDRLLFDSRFYYSERLWVICDEHFKQTFNPRTKQLSATSVKQKYDVTLESFGKPLRNPSEVYTWLKWYDDLWVDGVAVLTKEQLDSFLFHLDNAESQASKAKQRSLNVGQKISESTEGEAREESRYALRDAEVF